MSTEVIAAPAPELNESRGSDNSVQAKLVIREGHLRVEQVSAAELKNTDGNDLINISNISTASETQTVPEKPDLVTLMGGLTECSNWLLGYVAATNQYCRNENDIFNKIKREFSIFTEKEEALKELRDISEKIALLECDDEGSDRMYRTANSIRYLMDSCVTLHFFMKGSGGVERIIKDNHQKWYEDESWEAIGLPYETFQRILKGKVSKAMNGAIAGKYSNWPGVKEFVQRHTYSNNSHQIKFSELYRMMKKDFAAPHDIVRHMKMEDVLEHCVSNIPGLKLTGQTDERKIVTDSDVLDLVMKVKHLQQSGVKNLSKEFSSFHPNCRDWTSYHMTYQKLNQFFRNVLSPGNRRRSKSTPQDDPRNEITSTVLDSTHKMRHSYRAIGINTPLEKKSRSRSEEGDRHVSYNERGEQQSRSRNNSVADREDSSTVVYLNTDERSIVPVVGLPGSGKTTTLATMLGRAHNKTNPSTVLVISSDCCTTNRLLEYTSGTVLRACPAVSNTTTIRDRTFTTGLSDVQEDAEFSEDEEEEHEEACNKEEEKDSFEKVEEPCHSPCEELEKPESEEDKPYSPTEKVEQLEGDTLEEGEIREEKEEEKPKPKEEEKPKPKEDEKPKEKPEETAQEHKATKSKSSKADAKIKKSTESKNNTDPKIEDEFNKTELPWKVYQNISEVLNTDSEGRITVLHFPDYETMEAEVVCGVLEHFANLPSKLPKYLVIDNMDVLGHPCNGNTLDKAVEDHRSNNMSIWVATTCPSSLPINLLDFSTLAVLHRFTSKYWYTELADHLPVNSVTYQQCQGLARGQTVMVAPGANMHHPVHSSSPCYTCTIVPPKPLK